MARSTIAFLVALFCWGGAMPTIAQPYWVRHVGSPGNEHVSDVKVDETGHMYITGEFSGDADFGDSTFTATGGIDLFVAKLNADGQILWWKQAGGAGIDRGIKLAFGPDNTLAVVGEFMGVADFQGTTMASSGYTPDMYCALMDRATGDLLWVRQGGGSAGSDRPYGVTVSPTGQVTMAGEFKGTATWDGSGLTSTPEQETGEPTMDIVVVSYSPSGDLLWVQQGAADRQDRAIDVVNDPQGNIYVTGQFSDTITFDTQHINAIYNASFLLKLDAAGNEVWFRRCGGAIYDHVRDLLFTPGGDLLMVGDLQGTMIFLDDVPDFISGEQPYNYYLLRVSTDGGLLAQGQVGSQNGLSSRGIALRDDTIAVVGQFNCQFSALSTFYGGEGLFMAAGLEDIFVSKHRLSDLGLVGARQYGGPGGKLAGQVDFLADGDVVACGSYTRSISFATNTSNPIAGDLFPGYVPTSQPSPPPGCPNLVGANFRSQDATGLKDGFLARTYVEDDVAYDWWRQQPGDCDHPATWTMCAALEPPDQDCPDTLVVCGETDVQAFLPFIPSIGESNSVGPLVEAIWNTGDTAISTHAEATGLYEVQVHALNGCWAWSDAVYVVVNPMPPIPSLSDSQPQNSNATAPEPIDICDPDSVLIWCPEAEPWTTNYWTVLTGQPPPDTTYGTSIYADTTGIFTFHMVSDAGCERSIQVDVIDHATPNLDSLDLDFGITFTDDSLLTDSTEVCPGNDLQFQIWLQWFWAGDSTQFPNDLFLWVIVNGDTLQQDNPYGWGGGQQVFGTGWYDFHIEFLVTNGICGVDSLIYEMDHQIWVDALPEVPLDISLSGPASMCDGDSVLLTMYCPDCEEFHWSGGTTNGDSTSTSIWATEEGAYSVMGMGIDTNGCQVTGSANIQVHYPAGPLLYIDPADGIICPFDSALIYTETPGSDLVWYGPFGPMPNNSQQIWTEVPGEYYLTMIDTMGCELVSDPALVTAYSTPYLNILPDEVLCLNEEEAILQIVTTSPSSIVWAPPFSGNALQQTVTEPGVYAVASTACGITTEMSVTVVESTVNAGIEETGPYGLCTGETVVLHATPGQAVYIWQPGNVFADSLVVSQAGDYFLQVIDSYGCADTSDVVTVDIGSISQPLITSGDTICAGQTATITAMGSGTVTWYSDPSAQDSVFGGSTVSVDGLVGDTIFYVVQSEGPCSGDVQSVVVDVAPIPQAIGIDGPTFVCGGEDITLSITASPGANAQWTAPGGGTYTGNPFVIGDFAASDSGVYTAWPFVGGCVGIPITIAVGFAQPVPFSLGPDTTYCFDGWYTLVIPPWFNDPHWSDESQGYTLNVSSDGYWTAYAIDSNGCAVLDEIHISGIDCRPVIPNVFTPNGDGDNDVFTVIGSEGFLLSARFFNRWGQKVWEDSARDIHWNGRHLNGETLPDGVYYYELLRTGGQVEEAYTGYVHILRGGK